jgi:hypothetical protein
MVEGQGEWHTAPKDHEKDQGKEVQFGLRDLRDEVPEGKPKQG